MELKARLSQLRLPLDRWPKSGPEPAPRAGLDRSAGAPTERELVLEALRERMAEILGRPVPAPRAPADPSGTELPFVREETAFGPIYRSCQTLLPSHHVGRMPTDAAAAASAEMLALLALDPRLGSCDPTGALFLDTETTGLGGGAGVVAFLVGLGWFDADRRLVVEQLLLRRPGEEEALLRVVAERIGRASFVVSYNGKTFDWPLLSTRQVMNRLPALPSRPHLDLLHVARRLHRPRLSICRLVSLESEVLGFVRGPDIDGGEIAARYSHFLRSGDEEALRAVVEHNAWDVVSMAALVGLYGEPLTALHDVDLVGLARTLRRAGALEQADEAAHAAVERGVGPSALRVRGEIAKARGDRARALTDFEALSAELDDPCVRLELAKLYEHHVKQPLRALELVLAGTGEREPAVERRRARLERKIARFAAAPARRGSAK